MAARVGADLDAGVGHLAQLVERVGRERAAGGDVVRKWLAAEDVVRRHEVRERDLMLAAGAARRTACCRRSRRRT